MRFCVETLGCKVNQYETQAIANILVSRGHERAEAGENCDVCIVNTCAVTAESARKSRQAVRRLKKAEPGALIAVCGCLSQLDPPAMKALGADLIGGSGDRRRFALETEQLFKCKNRNNGDELESCAMEHSAGQDSLTAEQNHYETPLRPSGVAPERTCFEDLEPETSEPLQSGWQPGNQTDNQTDSRIAGSHDNQSSGDPTSDPESRFTGVRTRALLKIQDGCDNYCAYCVIPYARGRSRSLPAGRAAELARRLAERGYLEIVITGIEIAAYGKDSECGDTLTGALRRISEAAPGVRLRLGSLDPRAVTEGFCRDMSAIPALCDHFHLSLQSGCDDTLRRMGRNYDTSGVSSAAASLRQMFPGCGITADLITGFPGETDAEFERTAAFIRDMAFSGMHVFPFSPRPGTRAASMPGQVDKSTRRERARIASGIASESALSFKTGLIGKAQEVLFEQFRGGHWIGYSCNYTEVAAESGGAKNTVRPVVITDVRGGLVTGKIIR